MEKGSEEGPPPLGMRGDPCPEGLSRQGRYLSFTRHNLGSSPGRSMAPPPPPATHATDNWVSLLTGGSRPRGTPGPGWGGWRQRSQGKWVAGGTQHPGWRGMSLGPPVLPSLQTLPGLWSGLRTEAMPRTSWGAAPPLPTPHRLQC